MNHVFRDLHSTSTAARVYYTLLGTNNYANFTCETVLLLVRVSGVNPKQLEVSRTDGCAIVAAIALTLRRRPNTKQQKPEEQIAVKRSDSVRMVSMSAEERK